MRFNVQMTPEDLVSFTAVSRHPFVVTPTQTPTPNTERVSKAFRQRIAAYVTEHPGATTSAIREAVQGNRSYALKELKAMRADGTLRVVETREHGVPRRPYIADTIIEGQEAA
jgi:hypothetical protein